MFVAFASRCLKRTVFQAVPRAVGRTHASSVIPEVRSSDAESRTPTRSLTPSNDNAPPNRPAAVHAGPFRVPWFPLPLRSPSCVPFPSSNEYAATSDGGGGGGGGGEATVADASFEAGPTLPDESCAVTT